MVGCAEKSRRRAKEMAARAFGLFRFFRGGGGMVWEKKPRITATEVRSKNFFGHYAGGPISANSHHGERKSAPKGIPEKGGIKHSFMAKNIKGKAIVRVRHADFLNIFCHGSG
jgi:hypothetical protein